MYRPTRYMEMITDRDSQAELEQYCHEQKLSYVVDPTNADPAYTSRNAFRFALQALQKRTSKGDCRSGPIHSLRRWADRLAKRRARVSQDLERLLSFVQYDTPVKKTCSFDPSKIRKDRPEIRKLFLTQVARYASPDSSASSISPLNIEKLEEVIFRYQEVRRTAVSKITPGMGVMFTLKQVGGQQHWIVSRQPMRASEYAKASTSLPATAWRLWDNRFWYRSRLEHMIQSSNSIVLKPEGPWTLPKVSLDRREEAETRAAQNFAESLAQPRIDAASLSLDEAFLDLVEVGHVRNSKNMSAG